jgi:GNAT superfamily N-acetyltransferase
VPYLNENLIFVGEMDNRVVGFYALVQEIGSLELDHFWIHPDFMGQGIGRALFNHAISQAKIISPESDLKIISDPNAESFYLHMGALRTGTVSTDWGEMTRTLPLLRFSPTRRPQTS